MTSKTEVKAYAQELAEKLRNIAAEQEAVKDIIASAKDAGVNTKALRKVAKELVMESDKRAKAYDDEDQLEMFRGYVGLTKAPARQEPFAIEEEALPY